MLNLKIYRDSSKNGKRKDVLMRTAGTLMSMAI